MLQRFMNGTGLTETQRTWSLYLSAAGLSVLLLSPSLSSFHSACYRICALLIAACVACLTTDLLHAVFAQSFSLSLTVLNRVINYSIKQSTTIHSIRMLDRLTEWSTTLFNRQRLRRGLLRKGGVPPLFPIQQTATYLLAETGQ